MTYRSRYLESKKKYLQVEYHIGGVGESDFPYHGDELSGFLPYLSPADQASLRQTQKQYRKIKSAVETIDVPPYIGDSDFLRLLDLYVLHGVRTIRFGTCAEFGDLGIEYLIRKLETSGILSKLENLIFSGETSITDTGLENIAKISNLRSFELSSRNVTNDGIEHVSGLSNLHSLKLHCPGITDIGHLSRLLELQRLDLGGCDTIADDELRHLGDLLKLQSLNLQNCSMITGAGMVHIAGLSTLQSLNLQGCEISNEEFEHLGKLSRLQKLCLADCHGITDAGLVHLNVLKRLEYLDLSDTGITDAGLEILDGLASLRTLRALTCAGITGSCIARLGRFENLGKLVFAWCANFDGANLKHVSLLHRLVHLDLSGCDRITDHNIDEWCRLNRFNDLKELRLSSNGVNITEKSREQLRPYFDNIQIDGLVR